MTSSAVLNGSTNILYSGRFQAPGSILSARKQITGSLGRSVNSSSVWPGPMPRTLPLNASDSRSWPRAGEAEALGDLGGVQERVPGEGMHRLGVLGGCEPAEPGSECGGRQGPTPCPVGTLCPVPGPCPRATIEVPG